MKKTTDYQLFPVLDFTISDEDIDYIVSLALEDDHARWRNLAEEDKDSLQYYLDHTSAGTCGIVCDPPLARQYIAAYYLSQNSQDSSLWFYNHQEYYLYMLL